MTKKKTGTECCNTETDSQCSCKFESIISVDERGQMILPKELRDKAGIKPGEKLVVVSWEKEDKVCCFTLIKSDDMIYMVKDHLGPLMKDIL